MSAVWERLREQREYMHPVVFPVALGLVVLFSVFGGVFPGAAADVLQTTFDLITEHFGWFMIAAVAAFLLGSVLLMFSPYAGIKLGPDDSEPDYGYPTWFAMLFSAGMGIGLVFFGVAEPISHFADAPRQDSETVAAAEDAMVFTYHHWGLVPWAIYAIIGLSLAYFGFRHNLPLTVRSSLYPLIGERMNGWPGNVVDVIAVLGTLFGVATSLGLGTLQISAGLGEVFDVDPGTQTQVVLIAAITVLATISVFSGLDTGIRRLSQGNIGAAAILVLFVVIFGPTMLLIRAYFENIGNYAGGFVDVLFWTGTYGGRDWLAEWPLFYWAWWIAWSPFVGMFIARISRGRTLREFILGVLLVPTLISFAWFTVFGNSALNLELTGSADLVGPLEQGPEFVLFAFFESLPVTTVTSLAAIAIVVVFFVTSSDSASFVISMIASGGSTDPPRLQRMFWAVGEGAVAAVLLVAGGLMALQAGALSTGLPFAAVLLIVMAGLVKGLRSEGQGVRIQDVPEEPLWAGDDEEAAEEPAARNGDGPEDRAQPSGNGAGESAEDHETREQPGPRR